jgi:hypothetical protein
LGAAVWFNAVFYPGYGLAGLGKDQYRQALLRVGGSYAASESLTLGPILQCNFKPLGPGDRAYAWGTLGLLTAKGETIPLWVALKWSGHHWQRRNCFLLADPRDRWLFVESRLGLSNFKKISYTLENIQREEWRRLREVWGWRKTLTPPSSE